MLEFMMISRLSAAKGWSRPFTDRRLRLQIA
jgi:hypothetical protein